MRCGVACVGVSDSYTTLIVCDCQQMFTKKFEKPENSELLLMCCTQARALCVHVCAHVYVRVCVSESAFDPAFVCGCLHSMRVCVRGRAR